jgi:plastocyanin
MRRLSAVFLCALAGLLLLVAPPASAVTVSVSIQPMSFSPPTVTAHQGDSVKWTQDDSATVHTTTSLQGFWDSGDLPFHGTFTVTNAFMNAGSYRYECVIHLFKGTVKVPMKAAGSASTGWRVRWSSLSTVPTNRSFDVQIMRPGSMIWSAFRTGVQTKSAFFNPATSGTYKFRARTRNLSRGANSGYSPTLAVSIT